MFTISLNQRHSSPGNLGGSLLQKKSPITAAAQQALDTIPSFPTAKFFFNSRTVYVDVQAMKRYSKTFNSYWCFIRPDEPMQTDLDLEHSDVENLMKFLGGSEVEITPENILGIIQAASYFNTPVLFEKLLESVDQFIKCLESSSVDYFYLANLMKGFECSREEQIAFICRLRVTPEVKQELLKHVALEVETVQFLLEIEKEIAAGNEIKAIPDYKILEDNLPEMSCKEIDELFIFALNCRDDFKEPLLKKISKEILLKNSDKIEHLFHKFKNSIPNSKIHPYIDQLTKLHKTFEKFKIEPYLFHNFSTRKDLIKNEIDSLKAKIDELKVIYMSLVDNNELSVTEKNHFKNIQLLQKAAGKILSNFDRAHDIWVGKAKIRRVIFVIAIALGISAAIALFALALWYLFTQIPIDYEKYLEYNATHPGSYLTKYEFEHWRPFDTIMTVGLFTGIIWGPLLTTSVIFSLSTYLRLDEKLKNKHLVRGVHREMQEGTVE